MTNDEVRILSAFLYAKGLVPEDCPTVEINKKAKLAVESLKKLANDIQLADDESSEQLLQSIFFDAGKLHFENELRWWFQLLYQILLKQSDGPRHGQLTKLMTISWVVDKIQSTLSDPWITTVTCSL